MKTTVFAAMLLLIWTVSLSSQIGSTHIDACSLLHTSEAAAAIGTPVLQPLQDAGALGDIPFSHCTYKKNSASVGVLLTVYVYKSQAEVKKYFESSMQQVGDTEPVSGLGDGAYWWKSKATMFVIKDKYMVSILFGTGAAGSKAAHTIAEKVVNRIP